MSARIVISSPSWLVVTAQQRASTSRSGRLRGARCVGGTPADDPVGPDEHRAGRGDPVRVGERRRRDRRGRRHRRRTHRAATRARRPRPAPRRRAIPRRPTREQHVRCVRTGRASTPVLRRGRGTRAARASPGGPSTPADARAAADPRRPARGPPPASCSDSRSRVRSRRRAAAFPRCRDTARPSSRTASTPARPSARRSRAARRRRCRAARGPATPFRTSPILQARPHASCTPVLPPKPPLGGIVCAASPARNTRPC